MSGNSSDDFFGGNAPSAAFPTIGTIVGGRIVRIGDPIPQRDFKTKEPKFWDAAKTQPMLQLPVDIQTDLRDAEIPGDTGVRTIYIKGDIKRAVKEALRKVGAPGLRVSGTLEVAFIAEDAAAGTDDTPKKIYAARYTMPTGGDAFFGGQPAAQAQPAAPVDPFAGRPAAPPAAQPATVPAGPVNPFGDEPPF